MKCFIVLAVLVAVALAHPVDDSQTVILSQKSNVGTNGYEFEYKTSDGVSRFESGDIEDLGGENEALAVRGTVTWFAKDGEEYTLNYTAGKEGFQPEGKHLHTNAQPQTVPDHESAVAEPKKVAETPKVTETKKGTDTRKGTDTKRGRKY